MKNGITFFAAFFSFLSLNTFACVSLPPRVNGVYFSSEGLNEVGQTKDFNGWKGKIVEIKKDRDNCNVVKTIMIYDEKGSLKGVIQDDNKKRMGKHWQTQELVCMGPPTTRGIGAEPAKPAGDGKGKLEPGIGGCNQKATVIQSTDK